MSDERKTLRLDRDGRDVTDSPGLWNDDDTFWLTPLAWSDFVPTGVGKWGVRWKDRSGSLPLDWWVVEVDLAYLLRHHMCDFSGMRTHKDYQFTDRPIPEPMEPSS